MGVITTPNTFKALTFDGASSRNYGVFITGEAVFNAPERAVEMIEIPGRNGAFALDKGRFENIEVTYPAGIFADSEADFADAISDFRNYLCSRNGYVRLTDDYNPNEYRLAIYKSGLEVEPAQLLAGEFDITFECKPQRFLTSGETKVTLNSGDTVTNPTYFEASPLIEATGYGNINFNGFDIDIENAQIGDIQISNADGGSAPMTVTIKDNVLNNGDTFIVSGLLININFNQNIGHTLANIAITSTSNCTAFIQGFNPNIVWAYIDDITFAKGTALTRSSTVGISLSVDGSAKSTTATITTSYNGTSTLTVSISLSPATISGTTIICNVAIPTIYGTSTKSVLGNPTYINCDLGVAYMISGGEVVGLNRYIDLGSELPTLASGSNTITFDNTITKLELTPNWWKI